MGFVIILEWGDLCNIFVIFQYKGYTINTIHLVLGFLNKFHHNFLGIDYPHHYIIYLMGCLFHYISCFISIKHGITSKVQARACLLYIHGQWRKKWKTRTFSNWKPTLTFGCLQIYRSQQATFIWHINIRKSIFKRLFILAYWQVEKYN